MVVSVGKSCNYPQGCHHCDRCQCPQNPNGFSPRPSRDWHKPCRKDSAEEPPDGPEDGVPNVNSDAGDVIPERTREDQSTDKRNQNYAQKHSQCPRHDCPPCPVVVGLTSNCCSRFCSRCAAPSLNFFARLGV